MGAKHTGNVQPSIDAEEHQHTLEPATKNVLMYGFDGSAKQIVKVNSNGEVIITDAFQANDIDDYTTTSVTYVGLENKDGTWVIKKLDETGNFSLFTYATIINNPALTTYTLAWAARTTAVYNIFSTAF